MTKYQVVSENEYLPVESVEVSQVYQGPSTHSSNLTHDVQLDDKEEPDRKLD
jgi:hypothetical protein